MKLKIDITWSLPQETLRGNARHWENARKVRQVRQLRPHSASVSEWRDAFRGSLRSRDSVVTSPLSSAGGLLSFSLSTVINQPITAAPVRSVDLPHRGCALHPFPREGVKEDWPLSLICLFSTPRGFTSWMWCIHVYVKMLQA